MKMQWALLACLTLASCGALGGGDVSGNTGDDDNVLVSTVLQLSSSLFNRNQEAPPQFTATRASLAAAGINRPILVARVPQAGISVGLIEYHETRGAIVWRSLDGNTITTAGGLLRNTRGFGTDLHSLETMPLHQALRSREASEYSRVFRGLDGQSQVVATRLYCQLQPETRENIEVLGRSYPTLRYRETCHVADRPAPVFENTYWQGSDGTIWQSRQWAGPGLGYIDLERVNT